MKTFKGLPVTTAPGLLLLAVWLSGCAYYSFTGATIPEHLETVAIPQVEDHSTSPFTSLDETLTEQLTDRFVQQTRLSLTPAEQEADAVLTARIRRYENRPTSVGGQEQATRNRVTVTVAVTYLDQLNDDVLLDRTFSSFEDYDPLETGPDGEQAAAETALANVADDVFTAATSNW